MNEWKSFQVGDYTIKYHQRETESKMPRELFFDFKQTAPFIYKHNFLSTDEVKMLYTGALEAFPKRNFATVHDYGSPQGAKVDTEGRYTHFIPCSPSIYEFLEKTLETRVYPQLHEFFEVSGTFKRAEGWQVLGYGEGYFFNVHCDNAIHGASAPTQELQTQLWWANTTNRKFTILMYLNDQNDFCPEVGQYSGGDLALTKVSQHENEIVIKPKAGDLLAFPSNFFFTHEVRRVTHGYRFCCVTWVDVI